MNSNAACCIELASWTAATAMAVEGQWNRPIPTIFGTNLMAAAASLKAHPVRFNAGKS
jgi:hypothetical protein